jgi:tetratricopeptide (TPR) repeat protein
LQPNNAEALYSLGVVAREQGRLENATAWCRRALALNEGLVDAHYTLGAALLGLNAVAEAEASFRRAIALVPDFSIAHMGLAFSLLVRGQFAEGWREYEWRLRDARMAEEPMARPRWAGEPPAGRTILVRCEQGFGDSLQFIRYAEVLKRAGAAVLVLCRAPLARRTASCASASRCPRSTSIRRS